MKSGGIWFWRNRVNNWDRAILSLQGECRLVEIAFPGAPTAGWFASGVRWCCPALLFRTLQICLMRLQQMLQTNLLAIVQTAAYISWSPFTQRLVTLKHPSRTVLYTWFWQVTFLILAENFLHHTWASVGPVKTPVGAGPALSTSLFKFCVC